MDASWIWQSSGSRQALSSGSRQANSLTYVARWLGGWWHLAQNAAMPDYRRFWVPGGSFFFTVVTHQWRPVFADPNAVAVLGQVLRECKNRWSFAMPAVVLLPDHLHAIWNLPTGDDNYPRRWAWIKREFTRRWLNTGAAEARVSAGRRRERRRGLWQPRYWEHTLRDENDFERHFDYIHWNPVKHGYVRCPSDWPYSSFARYVRRGLYSPDWGCSAPAQPSFTFHDIEFTTGENLGA